jgi:hypothetical protein
MLNEEIKNKDNFLLIETGGHSWLRVEKSLVKIIEAATFQKAQFIEKKGFCFFEQDSELPEFLKMLIKATGLKIAKKDFSSKFQQENPLDSKEYREEKDQLLVSFSVNLENATSTFKLASAGFFGFKRKEATLFYNFETKEVYKVSKIEAGKIVLDFTQLKIAKKELDQAKEQRILFEKIV